MQLEIDKNVNLDELDVLYGQLARASEVDASVDILLPKTLENYFVGLIPALIQFLITWTRYQYSGKLMLDVDDPELEDFERIFDNELLYPAFTLTWNKAEFFNKTGQINIREFLKTPLGRIRNSILKVNPLKGNKLLLTSIDHFPFGSGGQPAFEIPDRFIDNKSNTAKNLKPAMENIFNFSHDAKMEFKEYREDFIVIMHELMKNTHEWARTDNTNIPLNPSVRGALVRVYKKRRNTFLQEYKMHKGLREYFESPVHLENVMQELFFIEMSIFDSGIGFVEKFSAPDKHLLNDIEIIKRCLMLHMTSAKGLDKDEKGIGLDEILQVLDGKGLIKIKTNKRCVYRNMITHPYKKVTKEVDLDLFDWNNSTTAYSEFPEAAGACITILYPLSTKPRQ